MVGLGQGLAAVRELGAGLRDVCRAFGQRAFAGSMSVWQSLHRAVLFSCKCQCLGCLVWMSEFQEEPRGTS